jgi:coenzyme F420-reducing hydrogenase delta subunit
MRIIRVMCSGRVDMGFILRAFSNGIDGVFIGACHLGECNYITHGNYHALNMVLLFKKIMEHIGLNPDRLRIQFMSGAEANVFVESTNDFVKTVKEIGPLGEAEGIDKARRGYKIGPLHQGDEEREAGDTP